MKKLRVLKDNISATLFLCVVIVVSLSICTFLFALSYYNAVGEPKKGLSFYENDIKDNIYLNFSNEEDMTYYALSKKCDLSNLAILVENGRFTMEYIDNYDNINQVEVQIKIVSKSLVQNYKDYGLKFDVDSTENEKQAYVSENIKNFFKVNKIYDIENGYEGKYKYTQSVKVLGYFNEYYTFDKGYLGTYKLDNCIVIFDDIPLYANVECGIVSNEYDIDYYTSLGFEAETIDDIQKNLKKIEVNATFLKLAISALLLVIVVILANYLLSIDKIIKRNGIMQIYGVTKKDCIWIEIIKMAILYMIAISISAIISFVAMSIAMKTSSIIMTWQTFGISCGVMLAIYVLSIAVGFIKFLRVPMLKSINNEYVE